MALAPSVIINLPGYPFENFPSLATIAALRDIPSAGLLSGDNYAVDGGAEAGDGDGGLFAWSDASVASDDGQNVIRPNDTSPGQAGRWVLTGGGARFADAIASEDGAGLIGFDPDATYPDDTVGNALRNKANNDLSGLAAVGTILTEDALTYPIGNELETYSQFSLTAADLRDDKREFIFSLCANFAHGRTGDYDENDAKVILYSGASMDLACRSAWTWNPLLRIKETCVDPVYANVCEFDIDNFNSDFGSANGVAGLSLPSVYSVTINGSNATSNTITAAMALISPPGGEIFERGYIAGPGTVKQAAFDDYSSATASYRDLGSHSVGVDLSAGVYTAGAIYIPNGAAILSRTSGGTPSQVVRLAGSNELHVGDAANHVNVIVERTLLPSVDNIWQLGATGRRFSSVWAVNGAIQTSDATLKDILGEIDPAQASIFIDTIVPKSWKWKVGGKVPVYGTEQKEVLVRHEKQTIRMMVPTGETREIEVQAGKFETVQIKREADVEVDAPVYEMQNVEVITGYEDSPGVRQHFGVLACDVKAAFEAAGFDDFGGYVLGEDGIEAIRPDQIMAVMLTEIRSLRSRVAALEGAG
jgi:hypothetical protein